MKESILANKRNNGIKFLQYLSPGVQIGNKLSKFEPHLSTSMKNSKPAGFPIMLRKLTPKQLSQTRS